MTKNWHKRIHESFVTLENAKISYINDYEGRRTADEFYPWIEDKKKTMEVALNTFTVFTVLKFDYCKINP